MPRRLAVPLSLEATTLSTLGKDMTDAEAQQKRPGSLNGDCKLGDINTKAQEAQQAVEQEGKKLDVVGQWLAEIAQRQDAEELLAPWTKEEEKRMVHRKIDPIIMSCEFWYTPYATTST